jgi:hypothetical protein
MEAERALPLAQAYALVADGDRRPLLVLRECDRCKGTDHALLSRTLDNEQTVLLTHWFRCVKLPTNVTNDTHPLHALFARTREGERVPHLFFADPDGGNRTELPGDQSQADLWAVMFAFLERNYTGNAREAVKELRGLLAQHDKLDALEQDAKGRLDREIERGGPESPKVKRLTEEVEKLQKRRVDLVAREKELRALALRDLGGKPGVGAAAGAAR